MPTERTYEQLSEAASKIQHFWRERQTTLHALKAAEDEANPLPQDSGGVRNDSITAALLNQYRETYLKQEVLLAENARLQQILHVAGEKKATDPASSAPSSSDAASQYVSLLRRLQSDRAGVATIRTDGERKRTLLREQIETLHNRSAAFVAKLRELRRSIALGGGTGGPDSRPARPRPAQLAVFEAQDRADAERDDEISKLRIEYLRTRGRLARLTELAADREGIGDGRHLIDFEQLKIENTSWNEKIEERNEDLLKMRKKATTTIHILTHVKEKLQFSLAENAALRARLSAVDAQLITAREALGKLKRERDALSAENVAMKEKTPLVGALDLLSDFEARKAAIVALKADVAKLRARHSMVVSFVATYQPAFAAAAAAAAAKQVGPTQRRAKSTAAFGRS